MNKKTFLLAACLIWAGMLLSGCERETAPAEIPTLAPTISLDAPPAVAAQEQPAQTAPAPDPVVLDPTCLVGTWQVSDLAGTIATSMNQAGAVLALEKVEGSALMTFDAQGGMQVQYHNLTAAFTGVVEGRSMRVEQSLHGSGTARYAVDPAASMLLLSDFGGDGIRSALAINGQVLAEGNLPVWQAFSGGLAQEGEGAPVGGAPVLSSRAAAACAGDALVLQMLEPSPGPALRLVRIQ